MLRGVEILNNAVKVTLGPKGVVTGTGAKSQRSGWRARLGRSRGCLPCKGRLGSERPKRAAGDEVALKVERVVDRSMHRQKTLG